METIEFHAIVNRTSTDKEGESKISFFVPQSNLMEVMKVMALTQQPLIVTVKVNPDANPGNL